MLSIVLLVLQRLFAWYYFKTYPKEKIEAAFKPISSKYGIRIVYEIGEDFFLPLNSLSNNSTLEPIRHRVLIRYPQILQKAFDKYPVQVIKDHLKAIYFAGVFEDDGLKYSGTYDQYRKIVYIVDNGQKNDTRAMRTFHHEFSSLLLKNHPFWIDLWIDNNPKNFRYFREKYSWTTIVKKVNLITKGSEQDYEKGFMRVHGQTSIENDFNEYSGMILTNPEKFKKLMDKYPRLRGKFLVWLKFYHEIDPIFTEEYLFGNQRSLK